MHSDAATHTGTEGSSRRDTVAPIRATRSGVEEDPDVPEEEEEAEAEAEEGEGEGEAVAAGETEIIGAYEAMNRAASLRRIGKGNEEDIRGSTYVEMSDMIIESYGLMICCMEGGDCV